MATDDAEAITAFPFKIKMWMLHFGATYALTHFFQSKEGASLDQYGYIAIDILSNPEETIKRVEQAYEQQLEAEDGDGLQSPLASERALASIEESVTARR